jgi:hypothetical protein
MNKIYIAIRQLCDKLEVRRQQIRIKHKPRQDNCDSTTSSKRLNDVALQYTSSVTKYKHSPDFCDARLIICLIQKISENMKIIILHLKYIR